jgi:hypothetical protein
LNDSSKFTSKYVNNISLNVINERSCIDLSHIENDTRVKELRLINCDFIADFDALTKNKSIHTLHIGTKQLYPEDILAIANNSSIHTLHLSSNLSRPAPPFLEILSKNTNIHTLGIDYPNLTDISLLSKNIRKLSLYTWYKYVDISPLVENTTLQTLTLVYVCDGEISTLDNISILDSNTTLRSINLLLNYKRQDLVKLTDASESKINFIKNY